MKSVFKVCRKSAKFAPTRMLVHWNPRVNVLSEHLRTVIACFGFCTLLALTPSATLADRGQGSIRAAARPTPAPPRPAPAPPPPRPAVHVEPPHVASEVRPDVHVQPPPQVKAPAPRDWDDNDEDIHHGGGFAHGAPVRAIRGQRVHDLPQHVSIIFNNQNYFYDDYGNCYQQQDGDYVVVQPPVGAVVPALPPGIVTVVVGPTTYYYLDGVFYVAQDNSFAVVNPPPGIVVPDLPAGANQVVVNGNLCYQFDGFNYQPSIQDGVTVYTVTPM